MSLLIKNGEIVIATERYVADIFCEGETITAIGSDLTAPEDAEVIDATGKYVFPGFIDPHVHIYLPFMGTFAKDTHETASRAALVGGTTTFIEMVCPSCAEKPLDAFELWLGKAEGASACDFTFHMGVTRYDDEAEADFREIVRRGVSSFKVFLAYKGAFGVTDEQLYQTLTLAKSLGVITTAHCENAELVAALQQKLVAEGKAGPEWHYWSRPPVVEAEGVHHLMTFAEMTGAHVYIVHLSCEESLREATRGAERGVNVWVETLIQYLLLDRTDAEKPDFEGMKAVMSPPLRDKKNQEVLWNGLRQGFVSTLATDHAPFDFTTKKSMGRDDFTKIPNGIPSLEDRVNLYFTHGVKGGRIDLHQFVATASTNTAKLFGLFPRKGTIQLGSDADLVVYDPNYRGKISAETHQMNLDYNSFEGMEIEGRPHVVTVRGKVAARDGKFVGEIGRGKFLAREPNHF
ncbi:MAG: dihydropyrimidinase [Verrucomicrobiota bacterium]|nr:dihydropyrimidinase [Chthoniobacterales bacterium]MDQ3413772.1 dihydropyrimidinase [Verrucomicrobiota bacterium]